MKQSFRLVHDTARRLALEAVQEAPDGWIVVVQEPTRSLEQNAAQWPLLTAFSQQLQWPVNGALCWLTPEEWKDILTAAPTYDLDAIRAECEAKDRQREQDGQQDAA